MRKSPCLVMQEEGVNVPRADGTAYAKLRRQCERNGYCREWGLPNELRKLKRQAEKEITDGGMCRSYLASNGGEAN